MPNIPPSFLLALREGLEVSLILAIVVGGLRKLQREDCAHVIWLGVASAIGVSGAAAAMLRLLGWKLSGPAEDIFEGGMLIAAAGLLTWMVFWMNRQSHALRATLAAKMCDAMHSGTRRALFMLTFFAVLREGMELALFLTAAGTDANAADVAGGAVLGVATAALIGWALFATTIRLDLRRVFRVTNIALILFAAGMAMKGVHAFEQLGWIPPLIAPVWNTSAVLSDMSPAGALLKGLFGYASTPSLTMVLVYSAYLTVVGLIAAHPARSR